MVAIKALVSILPFFISMATALPQDPATKGPLNAAPVSAEENNGNVDLAAAWNVSAQNDSVNVNFYEDKNSDSHLVIDPETCNGQSEIALMKWRTDCKDGNALFRPDCYSDAPDNDTCCPVPRSKSCKIFWPKEGE